MKALRLQARAAAIEALELPLLAQDRPVLAPGHALVRVHSAGVNPSDVKAALGLMPQAAWPRTPGRDYAGVVEAGPPQWLGRAVWGSGGDVGITRDGSHAAWLVLPEAALAAKPERLSMDEAGSVGVPFVTASEGLRRCGGVHPGQVVAVMGANGKVGQAAVQLALAAGAHVVAVQRGLPDGDSRAPTAGGLDVMVLGPTEARPGDVGARICERAQAAGRPGADIVFNTVGSPYFEAANTAMAKGATQVLIATVERPVAFDIFSFYRGMHSYVGIDTLALDAAASNRHLQALHGAFESGALRPFAVGDDAIYSLDEAATAYRRVLGGDAARVVLRP